MMSKCYEAKKNGITDNNTMLIDEYDMTHAQEYHLSMIIWGFCV